MGEDEDSPSKERNRPRVSSRWVSENVVIWDGGGEQCAEGGKMVPSKVQYKALSPHIDSVWRNIFG